MWGDRAQPDVWLGLAGPLASAVVSWALMAKAALEGPEKLMALMIKALAVKMVFFGAYVSVMFLVWHVRVVPFVASFTGFFVVFHAMEALFLKRLTNRSGPVAS
jgi:hypothetical protein